MNRTHLSQSSNVYQQKRSKLGYIKHQLYKRDGHTKRKVFAATTLSSRNDYNFFKHFYYSKTTSKQQCRHHGFLKQIPYYHIIT